MVWFSRTGVGFATAALLLTGCEGYRSEPLDAGHELAVLKHRDVQGTVAQAHFTVSPTEPKVPTNDTPLTEAQLIRLALAFNPDIRSRRYAATQLGWLGVASAIRMQPEMHVNMRSVNAGFSTDSEEIYTLLVPSARHAFLDADEARHEQARADVLAAECLLAANVRHAHMELRLSWEACQLLDRQGVMLADQARRIEDAPPGQRDGLAVALVHWQLADLHREQIAAQARNQEAKRALNALLGFGADYVLHVADLTTPLPAVSIPSNSDQQIDASIIAGRWELKASQAQYLRDDYEARRKAFERFPVVRVAPQVSYDRDFGTSFALGASMRIPWPGHAQEEYENARTQCEHDRATFIMMLQRFRAEAHEALGNMQKAALELKQHQDELGPADAHADDLAQAAWKVQKISAHDYLAVVQQRRMDEQESLHLQGDWLQASIDLDFATGRLNHIQLEDEPADQH